MSPFVSSLARRGSAADFARLLEAGMPAGSPAAPGLTLVAQLRSAGATLDVGIVPRPEFRSALRTRLMAVATVQAAQAPEAPRALPAAVSWRRRSSAVAAGAMASVVAVSGVAVAGSQSLPGDPFYGVKRTTEALQLQLAEGDVEKGTRHLDFAASRLREVRGLTLGRDSVDAGPVLGPAAISSGIRLRSAEQPLAAGSALSSAVGERVRDTFADMDEQTREGSELLTEAYRSSRASEPLQALSLFADRQSAGLEELLPALPPATQTRARASLALLSDVSEATDELIGIGTCAAGCDPTGAAPLVPVAPGEPAPAGAQGSAGCECPDPAPAPDPRPTAEVTPTPQPGPATSEPEPVPTSEPRPSSPAPSPSSSPDPLPVPVPVPVPTLPVPVPTITLAPVASAPAPAPVPAPTPVPQLVPLPLPPRP